MNEDSKTRVVDLHGYSTALAIDEIVPACIEAAWQRGYKAVKIIHGSPDIRAPWMASILDRGSMKWGLRRALNRGDFMPWAYYARSVKHVGREPDAGALTLALRPNPNPDPEYPWPDLEEPAYEYEGPWHRRRW